MILNRSVVDAASWRLASQLQRRHRGISVWNTHAGGGQYDALRLTTEADLCIELNRVGSVHLLRDANGLPLDVEKLTWDEYLSAADPRDFVGRVEAMVGLRTPLRSLTTTPPVLVTRVISALSSLALLGQPFSTSMGFYDSASGSHRADWWLGFRSIPGGLAAARDDDPYGEAGYRFWRCERDDLLITFETSTGRAWSSAGEELDMINAYRSLSNSLGRVVGEVCKLGQLKS